MKRITFILILLMALTLSACNSSPKTESSTDSTLVPAEYAGKVNPLRPDAASVGAGLFNTYCSSCHGPEGHGDGPVGVSLDPAPKNLPELSATVGDDYLFWRISEGRQGTAMVGWKGVLLDDQIWQVVSFIRALE